MLRKERLFTVEEVCAILFAFLGFSLHSYINYYDPVTAQYIGVIFFSTAMALLIFDVVLKPILFFMKRFIKN